MNKSHRVIWSAVRNCFVVASETAKAKGKPSSTRKVIAAAVAALFIAPGFASAAPACGNETSISGAVGAQCYTDQDVTINNTGSITVESGNAVYVNAAPYTKTFTNNGSISATSQGSTATVYFDGPVSGSIVNNGSVSVTPGNDYYQTAFYIGGDLSGSFTNSSTGKISVVGNNSDAYSYYGVNISGDITSAGSLTNAGSIVVDANNTSSTAYAYGINVNGNVDGSISNSGTIAATALGPTSAYAYGINVNGNLDGSLNNSGTISATAIADDSYASAYGINVDGSLGGTLTNSGTIKAEVNVYSNSTAYAYGINVGEDLTGSLVNTSTGTISAIAKNTHSYSPEAYGVYVNGNLSGSLSNAGTISATATGNTDSATAYGVYVSNDLSGTLTNTGTISATATVTKSDSAYAVGVYANMISGTLTNKGTISAAASNVGGRFADGYATAIGIETYGIAESGSIINEGTIQATANRTNDGVDYIFASAIGIYVGEDVDGVISNSGTITAQANNVVADSAYGSAYGVYVSGNVGTTGSITNSGTINAAANAYGTSYPYAYGIYVSGNVAGAITNNSGSITATAIGETDAYAYGVNVDGSLTGSLSNSGTIAAIADAKTNDEALAYGVLVGGTLANLSNSGTISASATGGLNSYASAYGISASSLDGSLVNSGNITASVQGGSASESNYAYGIYLNGFNGTITNSGTISATAADSDDNNYNAYSIFAGEGGSGIINNLAGGVLDGQVYVTGSVSLNNDGLLNTRLGSSFVGGDYTQGVTGAFKLAALDDMTYGSLTANGTATLAEGTAIRVAVDPAHTLTATSVLQNVISAGTLSMTSVNVQDNNLSLNFAAVNDLAGGVDLTAAATGLTTVAATVAGAGLSSAAGVGGVLDRLLVNPDAQSPQVTDFLYALGSSSTAQEVTNKVADLLPLMSGSVNYATLNTLRMMNLAVNQRQDANAGVSSGDLAFSDKHFWLKPFGSWANQDKRSNTLGYDSDSYGLVFGADGQISDANTVGLAIAYARTDMDSDMINQKANINSYQGTLYGSHKFSDVTSLNYQVDLGFHDNSGRRVITGIGSAKSDYDSWSAHAGVSLAHSIALSDVTTFTPSIRADYSRIRAESYHEKGAGAFNLNVGSETAEELILGADGKLARSLSDKATAFANLGVGYDVINDRTSLTSSFAGISNSTFTTRGVDPSPWLVRGGLGVVGQATETLELSLRYDFEVRNDFDNQTASVKARWAF